MEPVDFNDPKLKGKDLYLNAYKKILRKKLPYLFDVNIEVAIDTLNRAVKNLELVQSTSEVSQRIPTLGTTGEVLAMIALESKGIKIQPSNLIEDVRQGFDFTILGRKVDITTSPLDESFSTKYCQGHPIALFIPTDILSLKDTSIPLRDFYYENSYVYRLLYENDFDVNMFLEDTLKINYEVLGILYDLQYNGESNSYNLKPDQYGNVTEEYIEEYRTFLNDLSFELDNFSVE